MTKDESVSARVGQFQAAQAQGLSDAIGGAFDDGVASVPVAPAQPAVAGTFSQADMDAATAALQKALDDMSAKEKLEEAQVSDVQAKLDQIKAILAPPAV